MYSNKVSSDSVAELDYKVNFVIHVYVTVFASLFSFKNQFFAINITKNRY